MNILPPKKRKENRRSQEDHQSSDETSSYTSESSPTQEETESVSPISTSPPPPPSLIPISQSVPIRLIVDSPSLSPPPNRIRIKEELEEPVADADEILEVDDHNRSSEADSGVEDIKTEDDHSGHSDEDSALQIRNLDRSTILEHPLHPLTHLKVMALQQQARICRPIANRAGALPITFPFHRLLDTASPGAQDKYSTLPFGPLPIPFTFPSTFGFHTFPRGFLPLHPIPTQLSHPPSSPPPLAANRSFSPPRMRKLSPSRGNTIRDGNSPTRRMTRIDDSYFESQSDLGKRQKDEKLAASLGMSPRDIERVVSMPMDEFQDYGHQKSLTEDQMNILRDIRRRGKNKVAAQNCRKRKIDQIEELQGKVAEMNKLFEKNAKVLKEKGVVLPDWKASFWRMKQELEKKKREYVGCSQHPMLTKECLGKKGCTITVKLIRS
jgi:hypothetical protein